MKNLKKAIFLVLAIVMIAVQVSFCVAAVDYDMSGYEGLSDDQLVMAVATETDPPPHLRIAIQTIITKCSSCGMLTAVQSMVCNISCRAPWIYINGGCDCD